MSVPVAVEVYEDEVTGELHVGRARWPQLGELSELLRARARLGLAGGGLKNEEPF